MWREKIQIKNKIISFKHIFSKKKIHLNIKCIQLCYNLLYSLFNSINCAMKYDLLIS